MFISVFLCTVLAAKQTSKFDFVWYLEFGDIAPFALCQQQNREEDSPKYCLLPRERFRDRERRMELAFGPVTVRGALRKRELQCNLLREAYCTIRERDPFDHRHAETRW